MLSLGSAPPCRAGQADPSPADHHGFLELLFFANYAGHLTYIVFSLHIQPTRSLLSWFTGETLAGHHGVKVVLTVPEQ